MALFPEHCQTQELAGLLEGGHSVAVRDIADVDTVHLTKISMEKVCEIRQNKCRWYVGSFDCYWLYLQDHVPRQQTSVPGDDPLSVNVLDQDANQGCLVAADNADGKRFRGVSPRDLDTGEFAIRDQVMQLRKSHHCGNKTEAKVLVFFPYLYIFCTVPTKKRERISDTLPIKTEEWRMRTEQIEQEVKDCGGDVLQWDQLSLLPQVT